MSSAASRLLICPLCAQAHEFPTLAPGEHVDCVRCGTELARGAPRVGKDAALALTLTGILLAVPATLLPFVEVGKFQAHRSSYAFSGVRALWDANMPFLAIWVFLCGMVVPFLLLGTLAGILVPLRMGWRPRSPELMERGARALERWAMPEVHVLAVGVAFAKLGSLVDVHIGAGLWCYGAMSLCIVTAWRSFARFYTPYASAPATVQEAVLS